MSFSADQRGSPKANAIDLAASRRLNEVFTKFRDDPALRVCIVTGAGERFFSPGWDLKAASTTEESDEDWGVGGFGGRDRKLLVPRIGALGAVKQFEITRHVLHHRIQAARAGKFQAGG